MTPGRAQNTGMRPGWTHNASTRPGRRHSSWRAERRDAVQRPRRVSFPGPGLTNDRPQAQAPARQHSVSPASKTRWPQHNFSVQQHPAARPHEASATAQHPGATTPRGPASSSSPYRLNPALNEAPSARPLQLSTTHRHPRATKAPSARPLPGPSGGPWEGPGPGWAKGSPSRPQAHLTLRCS